MKRKMSFEMFWFLYLVVFTAILVHRWLPGSRNLKKSVHLSMQCFALVSGVFGIWTKFQGQDGIVANFWSLHSWMGLICMLLFGAQVRFFLPNILWFLFVSWESKQAVSRSLGILCAIADTNTVKLVWCHCVYFLKCFGLSCCIISILV